MIAFEICHFIKRKRQGKNGMVTMKTDMSKAYDRLEWQFHKEIMQKLGFHDKWVDLIMQCVCSVQYKILHNGTEIGPITLERGLRQGVPLSPYLFIICVDSLSSTLKGLQDKGFIHGCSIARSAPPIFYFFFAGDNYFFFKACPRECSHVKECLIRYERALGQRISLEKSTMAFSPNISDSTKSEMCV